MGVCGTVLREDTRIHPLRSVGVGDIAPEFGVFEGLRLRRLLLICRELGHPGWWCNSGLLVDCGEERRKALHQVADRGGGVC